MYNVPSTCESERIPNVKKYLVHTLLNKINKNIRQSTSSPNFIVKLSGGEHGKQLRRESDTGELEKKIERKPKYYTL